MVEPFVARLSELERQAALRRRGLKLFAHQLYPGERLWKSGEWVPGSVAVSDVFEVGFFLPSHEQDLHMHAESYEVYVFLGRGWVEYLDEDASCLRRVEVTAGDLVVFPPRLYHRVGLEEGSGYTILVGRRRDKIVYAGKLPPKCPPEEERRSTADAPGDTPHVEL